MPRHSVRILARPAVTTPDEVFAKVLHRLQAHRVRLEILQAAHADTEPACTFDASDLAWLEDLDTLLDTLPDEAFAAPPEDPVGERLHLRAERHVIRRHVAVKAMVEHLRAEERSVIERAVGRGVLRGMVTRHAMHERIAALHAEAPWMAPAATAVMQAMEQATRHGPAPFQTPPLILLGGPGIGKSRWARDLAQTFAVPALDIDIGAANGAVFALSGVERGWGNAGPGRLARSLLSTHVANPLVIIDELDKIPASVTTARGTSLPGAAEVLKSMIEPATAKAWTCPFYQLPFDLRHVSWVMTTNSLVGIPPSLLDRCRIVHIPDPTPDHLGHAAARMIARRTSDADLREDLLGVIRALIDRRHDAGQRTSLRQIRRIVDRFKVAADRVRVN